MANESVRVVLEWWDGETEWLTMEGVTHATLPDTIEHRGAKFFRKPWLKSKEKKRSPRYQTMSTKPKEG